MSHRRAPRPADRMSDDQDATPPGRTPRVAWTTCTICGLLHSVEDLLEFDPVCLDCTAR
jgi:hypothetical protein